MGGEGLAHKRNAVSAAVRRAQEACKLALASLQGSADDEQSTRGHVADNAEYAKAMLREVGGFEIAAMAGAIMHAKEVRH